MAGEFWKVWTNEQGPMVPVAPSVQDLIEHLETIHREHETYTRRMNEMMAAVRRRLFEYAQSMPKPAPTPPSYLRPAPPPPPEPSPPQATPE
ncbi:MAG: hypothetical protein OEW90_00995 [Betaproteobacteria bacterium]|nr:hypothetical protein [Betaproteobacteria bacterium]MDH4322694.1 hypothetical protein [Betaproteobacteria bacterium]